MTDIDKAAREYAKTAVTYPYSYRDIKDAFTVGAQSRQPEIDELIEALEEMRWIPVGEGLPEDESPVLVKMDTTDYDPNDEPFGVCAFLADIRTWINQFGAVDDDPTHWRPIDTPKATQLLEKYGKK